MWRVVDTGCLTNISKRIAQSSNPSVSPLRERNHPQKHILNLVRTSGRADKHQTVTRAGCGFIQPALQSKDAQLMEKDILQLIQAIHKCPQKAVIYATGGGLQVVQNPAKPNINPNCGQVLVLMGNRIPTVSNFEFRHTVQIVCFEPRTISGSLALDAIRPGKLTSQHPRQPYSCLELIGRLLNCSSDVQGEIQSVC